MLSGVYVKNKAMDFGLWSVLCVCLVVAIELWHVEFRICGLRPDSESLRTNHLLYCADWTLELALSERASLKGLVGVRNLCVCLDLPLDVLLFLVTMLCLGKNKMQMKHFTHSLLKVLVHVNLSCECFWFKVYYFLQQTSSIRFV